MNDKEIERGFQLVIDNAESLVNESALLLKNGFFSRAYSLAQLAIEEVGKCSLLHKGILDFYQGKEINAKYFNDVGFLKHQVKTLESLKSELLAIWSFERSIGQKTDLRQALIADFKQVEKLNNLKNSSLYVGITEDSFKEPSELISKEMAYEILDKAKLRLAAEKPLLFSLEVMKEVALAIEELENDPEKKKEILGKINQEFASEF